MKHVDRTNEKGVTSIEIPANNNFTSCKSCTNWKILHQEAEIA
jgi:hypothetical protein